MKKRSALTLAALALMVGGVTVFGVKNYRQNRRERQEIEKKLNALLVQDAERKLDSLYKDRDSTLVLYHEALMELNRKNDSLQGVYGQVWKQQQISKINYIIGELLKQARKSNIWIEMGELQIPGDFERYDPELSLHQRIAEEREGVPERLRSEYNPWWSEDVKADDPEQFLYLLQWFSIPSMDETVYSDEKTFRCLKGTSLVDILDVLDAFLDNLDNMEDSKHVFNEATLRRLNQVVLETWNALEQISKLNDEHTRVDKRAKDFESGSDKLISAQRERLWQLKRERDKYKNM